MAQKRDYATTPPQKLTELNKDSMLNYVVGLDKEEDISWLLDLFENNKGEKGYNMKDIRIAFANRYFAELTAEKKKKKATNSFDKRLDELRKKYKK